MSFYAILGIPGFAAQLFGSQSSNLLGSLFLDILFKCPRHFNRCLNFANRYYYVSSLLSGV